MRKILVKMKIRTIHGHGKADEEYVILDVLSDCNLNHYMVADSTFTKEGKISNKARHTHWFVMSDAKKGDIVVLYTGVGRNKAVKSANDSTVFHRYWGLKSAVWNDDGDGAVLLEINTWKTTKVSSTK